MLEDDRFVINGPAALKPLPNISLGRLIYDSLSRNPNTHPALVDAVTNQTLTYKELLAKTSALAKRLRLEGYGKGDIFTISSENHIEFFVPVIATFYLGAIIAPVNHNYTINELIHTLNITKPRIVFCSQQVSGKFLELKKSKQVGFIEKIIIIDDYNRIGTGETESLLSFCNNNYGSIPESGIVVAEDFDPSDHSAAILCSSGTTGLPKGVEITHTNIIVRYMHTIDPRYHSILGSQLGIMPFFHGFGFVVGLCSIILNESIVVMQRFDEHLFLNTIAKYRIGRLFLAPPLALFLAKSPLVDRYDLSFIGDLVCGAAPLNKVTEECLKKRMNVRSVRQGYGLTEATLAVIAKPISGSIRSIVADKFGTSGEVMPYMSVKIRDPDSGRSLGPNQVGEICVKGPMVMKGYHDNIEATRNSFTPDGWLLTGDLAYYDDDHYFYIVDRLKELIKYKGFQVAPAEIEATLLTHPAIKDAGVVGVPHGEVGELPLAFVVKQSGKKLTEEEVHQFIAGKLSSQKHLRGGVVFLDAIPKNPSGKILRRELRKLVNKFVKAKL